MSTTEDRLRALGIEWESPDAPEDETDDQRRDRRFHELVAAPAPEKPQGADFSNVLGESSTTARGKHWTAADRASNLLTLGLHGAEAAFGGLTDAASQFLGERSLVDVLSNAPRKPTVAGAMLGAAASPFPLAAQPVLGGLAGLQRGDTLGGLGAGLQSGLQQSADRLGSGLLGMLNPEHQFEGQGDDQGQVLGGQLGLTPEAGKGLSMLAEILIPLAAERGMGRLKSARDLETFKLEGAPDLPDTPALKLTAEEMAPPPEPPPVVVRNAEFQRDAPPGGPPLDPYAASRGIADVRFTDEAPVPQGPLEPPARATGLQTVADALRESAESRVREIEAARTQRLRDEGRRMATQDVAASDFQAKRQPPEAAPPKVDIRAARATYADVAAERGVDKGLARRVAKLLGPEELRAELDAGSTATVAHVRQALDAGAKFTRDLVAEGWTAAEEARSKGVRNTLDEGRLAPVDKWLGRPRGLDLLKGALEPGVVIPRTKGLGSAGLGDIGWEHTPRAKEIRAALAEAGVASVDAATQALIKMGAHPARAAAAAQQLFPTVAPPPGPVPPAPVTATPGAQQSAAATGAAIKAAGGPTGGLAQTTATFGRATAPPVPAGRPPKGLRARAAAGARPLPGGVSQAVRFSKDAYIEANARYRRDNLVAKTAFEGIRDTVLRLEVTPAERARLSHLTGGRSDALPAPELSRLSFADRMERGLPQSTPELTQASRAMFKNREATWFSVQGAKGQSLLDWWSHWYPHRWKDPAAASGWAERTGRAPVEGGKAFEKSRTIPFTTDGIAAGLDPVSFDPVDLHLGVIDQMNKYLMADRFMGEMTGAGYLDKNKRAGWVPVEGIRKGTPVYMPPPIARIFNSYLAPSAVKGNVVWDAAFGLNSASQRFQLGFSAFHFMAESINDAAARVGLGLQKLTQGEIAGAAGNVALGVAHIPTPIGPINLSQLLTLRHGSKMLEEWVRPGSAGGVYADMVENGLRSGLSPGLDMDLRGTSVTEFTRGMQERGGAPHAAGAGLAGSLSGNLRRALVASAKDIVGPESILSRAEAGWKAGLNDSGFQRFRGALREAKRTSTVLNAPLAIAEYAMRPLMQWYVPRLKIGAFFDHMQNELSRPEMRGATPEQIRRVGIQLGQHFDYMHGQLIYDNYFWNQTLKHVSQFLIRAPGWTGGTLMLFGKGAAEAATGVRQAGAKLGLNSPAVENVRGAPISKRALDHNTASSLGLGVVSTVLGSTLYYMYNGKAPEKFEDTQAVPTGRTLPDGTPEKMQLPTYLSKDVPAWANSVPETIGHKLGPLVQHIKEGISNENYFHDQLYSETGGTPKWYVEEVERIPKLFVPFAAEQASRLRDEGEPLARQVGAFFGVTPAPGRVRRTPAENRLHQYMDYSRGVSTPDESASFKTLRDFEQRSRRGEDVVGEVHRAVDDGLLTWAQADKLYQAVPGTNPKSEHFKALSLTRARDVYSLANDDEKALWKDALERKEVSARITELEAQQAFAAHSKGKRLTDAERKELIQLRVRMRIDSAEKKMRKEYLDKQRDRALVKTY